jgi:prophage regulatory protein
MKTAAQRKHEGQASATGRFLRINDVVATVGLSRATIYRMIANDQFPKQVRLTPQCSGWWQAAVDDWVRARLSEMPQAG